MKEFDKVIERKHNFKKDPEWRNVPIQEIPGVKLELSRQLVWNAIMAKSAITSTINMSHHIKEKN